MQKEIGNTELAAAIRILSADAIEKAKSGHPGMPLGFADVATILFSKFLKFNVDEPKWINRDRFVLSVGHGSMLLYAISYLLGYKSITLDDIKNFRQLASVCAGHPENDLCDFIETTTGPLGQGLANAVGMALGERKQRAVYGKDIIDHYTYCIVGDGCLMEGISQEAIAFAGHHKLRKLIILWDDNNITIDGKVSLSDSTNQLQRFAACGFNCQQIDGHDYNEITKAIELAKNSDLPSFIACKTIIGKGANKKAGSEKSHGSPLGGDEIDFLKSQYNLPKDDFIVPEEIISKWRTIGKNNLSEYEEWQQNYNNKNIKDFSKKIIDFNLDEALQEYKASAINTQPMATRVSSGKFLEFIKPKIKGMIGGSADLTGSNNTFTPSSQILDYTNPQGNYINYGIREHAMAAIMNGLALYGGFIPYGGMFLVFSDYCRPSIRLAALMKLKVIFVFTHDSIGVGEDGPTHQPIEHFASLRAIPRLKLYRPADHIEVAECWIDALAYDGPSALVLTRQNVMNIRASYDVNSDINFSARGGYVLKEDDGADVTLIATGSEVSLVVKTQELLQEKNISSRIVSLPCFENFFAQDNEYKKMVLGNKPIIALEAGIKQGWAEIIGRDNLFIGLHDFGSSAPAKQLFEYFGLEPKNICTRIIDFLAKRD